MPAFAGRVAQIRRALPTERSTIVSYAFGKLPARKMAYACRTRFSGCDDRKYHSAMSTFKLYSFV
jgi:hypothetical protein